MKPAILTYTQKIYADQWAEQHVILKDTGRFRYDVTPYFREPTRAASDLTHVCRVVVKSCAQLGKTSAIQNLIGWMAEFDPSNALVIMDSLKTGQRFSKNRLKPFLRDTCGIAAFDKTKKDRSKETCNLSLGTGANLIIGSASSASDLCSTPVKYLFADELDRWTDELGAEGDPLLNAFKRQLRFMGMALLTSTPTRPDGRINQHWTLGTMETWSAVCAGCDGYMRVSYDDIDFTTDPPIYACPECGKIYTETEIIGLPHTYAPPANSAPFTDKFGRVARSFEITATLCHRQYTWDALKKEQMQAEALGEAAIASFRNTALGETYTPPEQKTLDVHELCKFAVDYTPNNVPSWVDVVCMGVDTQHNAFPWTIIGMSADMRKLAIIEAGMILGDLRTPQPWKDLLNLAGTYQVTREDGVKKRVMLVGIDSGGHSTQDIYALCMQNPRMRALKGCVGSVVSREKSIVYKVSRAKVREVATGIGKVDLTMVNVTFVKEMVYSHLQAKVAGKAIGDDWIWPAGFGVDANFFEQVTAEVRRTTSKGYYRYDCLPYRENHFLDCLVYGITACETVRLIRCDLPVVQAKALLASMEQPITPTPTSIPEKTETSQENLDTEPENLNKISSIIPTGQTTLKPRKSIKKPL